MSFRVFSRSVKAQNRPASVRPDSVDLYVQLDIYHDHLTSDVGCWTKQVAPCTQNTRILYDSLRAEELYVANPFRLIRDVVICSSNNEDDDDYQSLEDGRSRRYFLRNGTFAHMFSIPIESAYVPLTFVTFPTKSKFVGSFRSCYLRLCSYGNEMIEILICIVGGKNLSDYKQVSINDYKDDISNFMLLCERTISELNDWVKKGSRKREYVILMMKDHCAPIEAFDPAQFNIKYGKRWNFSGLDDSAIECDAVAGWFDLYGWYTPSKKIRVYMTKFDYDDHSRPCMYDVITPYTHAPSSLEREHLRSYYIERPWRGDVKYRQHDGTVINEYSMEQIRSSRKIQSGNRQIPDLTKNSCDKF
ncbi:MAG: hypothetical protein 3 [Bactrocera dorsalis orbivirus isolate Zc]|nr:MAG: hypothetical protein 3 [Bactrocera dorsalis orbivirus isolate Zc]